MYTTVQHQTTTEGETRAGARNTDALRVASPEQSSLEPKYE